MKSKYLKNKGQALISLLIFVIIAITITSAAIIIIATNSRSAQELESGTLAYYVAESGVENALLRLLRNPSYTGETMNVGDGTAVIEITGTEPKTITSTGSIYSSIRKIRVVAGYTNNILTINSWEEIN